MDLIEKASLKLSEDFSKCKNSKEVSQLIQTYLHSVENNDNNVQLPWPEDNAWINVPSLSQDDIVGKVVLLDFFTYCCINCIHIMPFLHKIEKQFSCADGLVVIGVHSAKFPNEKVSNNVVNALLRYNIVHPVINDFNLDLWNNLNIKCWPTLVVVSPRGKVLLSLPGEAHLNVVELLLSEALLYYKDRLSRHEIISLPASFSLNSLNELKFPGKVAIDKAGNRLAVSDSANNRIIICNREGKVFHVVGSGKVGKQDGDFSTCAFNSPQGVAWHRSNTVFVADCDNHLIRKIDLSVKKVMTVAGTGQQGNDYEGGKFGIEQVLSSPWDIAVAGSPMFPEVESILYIAMSGIHQIWAFFLQDADWQKGSEYKMGTCMRMAGSGQEENRNNSYPHKAGFAQPSGLAVDVSSHKMFVADSESSTIRRVSLANGAVEGLIGGHFDPTNLFAFGDADGKARNAKLQHPLAVAWDSKRERLYVADSYNHKIKIVNPASKTSFTLCGSEDSRIEDAASLNLASVFPAVHLNEPGGLCIDPHCEQLYIADTNNHDVKILTLSNGEHSQLQLKFPASQGFDVTDSSSVPERGFDVTDSASVPEQGFDVTDSTSVPEQGFDVTDSVPVPKLHYRELVSRKNAVTVRHDEVVVGRNFILELLFRVESIRLTSDAPSSWQLSVVLAENNQQISDSEQFVVHSGEFRTQNVELSLSLPLEELCKLLKPETVGEKSDYSVTVNLVWEAILYFCRKDSQLCLMRQIYATIPVQIQFFDASVKSIKTDVVIASL